MRGNRARKRHVPTAQKEDGAHRTVAEGEQRRDWAQAAGRGRPGAGTALTSAVMDRGGATFTAPQSPRL